MKKDTHVGDRMACDNDKAFMCQIPTGNHVTMYLKSNNIQTRTYALSSRAQY